MLRLCCGGEFKAQLVCFQWHDDGAYQVEFVDYH